MNVTHLKQFSLFLYSTYISATQAIVVTIDGNSEHIAHL